MQTHIVPPPMVRPLDSNEDLIDLLVEASQEPRDVVMQRLWEEECCVGTNVRRDLLEAEIEPHVWSDELATFYRTTKAFLYETSAWNRAPLKLVMRDWIGRFLVKRAPSRRLRVLSFGDGLGFDSVYLASAGHDVTYYEVADECVAFARRVFAANQQQVQVVQAADALPEGAFDVVLSLDVLEHVPSPPDCVSQFARWLKPGGWLITHSPFFFTSYHRVTHLHCNRRHSGSTQLFTEHGLQPVAGRFFWDPIVLEKTSGKPAQRELTAMRLGGGLLTIGRVLNHVHCAVAQQLSRTDRRWRDDLARLIKARPAYSEST